MKDIARRWYCSVKIILKSLLGKFVAEHTKIAKEDLRQDKTGQDKAG